MCLTSGVQSACGIEEMAGVVAVAAASSAKYWRLAAGENRPRNRRRKQLKKLKAENSLWRWPKKIVKKAKKGYRRIRLNSNKLSCHACGGV
jgi:hypothetical protein